MAKKFFWADQVAEDVIKKNPKKKTYVCASGITPSGTVHIGNFREVITTDLVVRALKDKGKKVRFIYSWDDYDRFRGVPANIKKDLKKYLGMPLSRIPSPFEKNKSYARHFEEEFEKSLEKVKVIPEFISQTYMNEKCKYAELIKTAIEKRKEIMEILNKYRKEPLSKDWYPVTVYCEKCKKDSTKIINSDKYEIEYKCKCRFQNKIDFRKKGVVKLRWRVDWPARWKYEKVDFEPGGIDHSAPGSSFDTGKEIAKKIFNYPAPFYVFYDWIRIKGGKEFSSSKGNVTTLKEVEDIYEPEIIRYIFASTRPQKGFQISFDNDVIKIYEDYDNLEKRYYEKKVNEKEKRIYETSQISLKKKMPRKESFRHLITLVQVGKTDSLSEINKKRTEKVKNWLEKYADKSMKFKVQEKVKVKLNEKEKKAMLLLRETLKENLDEEELFKRFYEICKKLDMKNKDFFRTAYKVIINKSRGPRLAGFILNIGKEKIIKILKQIK